MTSDRDRVARRTNTTTVLLAPLLLFVAIPLAIAVGHDFFYFAGDTPVALGFCGPAGYLLFRRVMPWLAARLAGEAGVAQVPKSIS